MTFHHLCCDKHHGFCLVYKDRQELELDVVWAPGLDDRLDAVRYDVSWQYRLKPAQYPQWGISPQLNFVAEWNGRWLEGQTTTQQLTLGLQWIRPTWVLEGGVVQDLNTPHDTQLLLSLRVHF